MKLYTLGFLAFIFIFESCQSKLHQKEKDIAPIVLTDTSNDYSSSIVDANKGFFKGVYANDILQQKKSALKFVKKVIGAGKKDNFDIDLSDDSSFYQIDKYTPSVIISGHSQTSHLFFFPRTKNLFYFTYGDTLTLYKVDYDTVKYRY